MPDNSLLLHRSDDVAIALESIEEGRQIRGITIAEPIPELHKFAVRDLPAGAPVRKYGEIIGYTSADVSAGNWIHTHNLEMGKLLEESRKPTQTGSDAPDPIDDRYFLGFPNRDGNPGTRNYIAIASTVDCSAHAVDLATEELNKKREWYSRRFANVDGIVGLTHDSGCGLVGLSPGHLRQNLTMRNLLDHPNVGASVVVQLGCEKSQAGIVFGDQRIVPLKDATGPEDERIPFLTIQEHSGTWETVEQIVRYVEDVLLPAADKRRRKLFPAKHLVIAEQCGGSDAASGLTANASIGYASDLFVRCGATPFISETTETFGAEHIFGSRAANPEIAEKYLAYVNEYVSYLGRGSGSAQSNLSYGNKQRGLTTIAEKSLGAIAKAGTTNLCWVVDYGERITEKGLGFMNGPAFDPASATGQTAGGAQVGIFSTGSGSCFGGILSPWVKVVSNSETWNRMVDMEINAGGILEGTDAVETVGREIFETALAVASGAKTYSEKTGYSVVNIWNSGSIT